jgi:hypothetical protein
MEKREKERRISKSPTKEYDKFSSIYGSEDCGSDDSS